MGTLFSCPFGDFNDLDSRFENFIFKSINFGGGEAKSLLRSVSFNGRESEPATTILKSYGSAKFVFERSLSLKRKELERMLSFKTPTATMENNVFGRGASSKKIRDFGEKLPRSDALSEEKSIPPEPEAGNQRNHAALKLQKVYKSFRTRRRLADCAVMVEQRWWKLLDFAELKRSSISFFDIEKPETAISRWSRARTRAAKVGKGLSKDEKARKLALQHWLEATEREAYEVSVQEGKFMYKKSGELLDTKEGPKDAKWIFVLSTSKTLYVGMKNKGTFQHSSFLAGGATLSAGRLIVEDGILKAVWPHSGHYLPTEENFQEFMSFLTEHNVDLTNVKKSPSDEETTGLFSKKSFDASIRSSLSKAASTKDAATENTESLGQQDSDAAANTNPVIPRLPRVLCSKLTKLEIPERNHLVVDIVNKESLQSSGHGDHRQDSISEDGYETAEESFLTEEDFMFPKWNLFDDEDQEEEDKKPMIPKEKIIQRIDSHKGMKSYQLAQHLSTRWSTGAGPRIGCMRDYPSELQFRVLEQANLSPRSRGSSSSPRNPSRFYQKVLMTPTSLGRDTTNT
ncbi:hypothetical protein L484_014059 [Morus notabilis]|uniref:Uncharacterized protein n=1 Tax=Morus notabilis TaxID=981085 RepID=W9QN77_9ROSA|nr:hypothetical protein L484_014059 [Morus notabilis]